MKVLVERLNNNSTFEKIIGWTKLAGAVGIFQLMIQAISFACGIFVIRLLPTQEYALYTLANTTLGAMTILADGGIAAGVMAQGGQVWQDREQFGKVLATGLNLRKKFAAISLVIFLPGLLYLLHYHGASWATAALISVSIVPAFFTALSGTLFSIVPRLAQHIVPLQKVELGASVGRLVLLGLSIFAFPVAFIALLAAGLPQFWSNFQLKNISKAFVDDKQKPDAEIRVQIFAMVKRLLPESIYYCISGQLTIWIISILGSTAAVAQVGALGRVSILFILISTITSSLVVPRFARLPNDANTLLKRFLQIQLGLTGAYILIVGACWLFSSQILLVLGDKYTGLSKELVLLLIGSTISSMAGNSFYLSNNRGWVINPAIPIIVSIVSICLGVYFLKVSSLEGVLIFNIFIAIPQLIVHFTYAVIRARSVK
ncbi:polysaccharide biosynthesis protein [Hymenobacter setariae]|uniref:Polysaccharide biosynthesis protein n=1 Tax=Hymenobacter setariae TaxID=2594794 RepID=A0A558BYB6_9BACT|nr:polysaccharide biosynthesis protein [Hymenobacter setariae]TVT41510.1 polysaccharide biosynthesis protein [Hymenobacter setariae]